MVVFSRKYSSLVMKIQGEFKLVLVEKSLILVVVAKSANLNYSNELC